MRNYSNFTHFGFKKVLESEKQKLVGNVFSSVAKKYDLMNDLMSAGAHRCWKDTLIKRLHPTDSMQLLDVAGGTGDIAFRFLKHVNKHYAQNTAKVTVLDLNQDMLAVGRQKAKSANVSKIEFVHGNAEELSQIPSNSMDAYTIAFGIRNCTHMDKVLQEAYRVLKPNGHFLCLEFSRLEDPTLQTIYDLYSFHMIPWVGKIVASDANSYQYLVESIRKFPNQQDFKKMIENSGFKAVSFENLFYGLVAIHHGWKV